jgi:hypothetical protein
MATLRALREAGLVQMGPSGRWELTQAGRDVLDMLDMLRDLDDRPRASRASSPLGGSAQRGQATRTAGGNRKAAPERVRAQGGADRRKGD